MRDGHIAKAIKAFIAYFKNPSSANDRWFFLSFLCGFCMALFAITSNAETPNNSITIDVNNPKGSVDYQQVDRFVQSQNKVHYAVQNGNELILSDKKIVETNNGKVEASKISKTPRPDEHARLPAPYQPSALSDLGYTTHPVYNVTKSQPYHAGSHQLNQVPSVPATYHPPVTTIAVKSIAKPVTTNSQPKVNTRIITMDELLAMTTYFWLTTITVTMVLLTMLSLLRNRRQSSQQPAMSYTGKLGAPNEMIGEGTYFDFNGQPLKGEIVPINSNYLNILWQVGNFSKQGAINTYFYMAFYIPPHEDYAAQLAKKSESAREQNKANVE